MIAPVPVKQPWRIWVNKSYEYARNANTTKLKQNITMCIATLPNFHTLDVQNQNGYHFADNIFKSIFH